MPTNTLAEIRDIIMSKQYRKSNQLNHFLTRKTVASSKRGPQTADEYIELGTDLEESGDRWRNQDNPKSSRFYVKAIDAYESALKLAPNSIEAAYNRARLQLTIGTNEQFLPPGACTREMLQDALTSHLYCLQLPDELIPHSNTGQAYITLAEELSSGLGGSDPRPQSQRAVELLWNGIGMFDKALVLQEKELQSILPQDINMDTDEDGGVSLKDMDTCSMESMEAGGVTETKETEQWAVIKEPVTKTDVLDTVLAKLEALTLLCGLAQYASAAFPGGDLFIYQKEQGADLLSKLDMLLEELPDSKTEAALPRANFTVAVADLGFKHGSLSTEQYTEHVQQAFSSNSFSDPTSPIMSVNQAEAYIQLAQTLSDRTNPNTADVTLDRLLPHYNLAAKSLAVAATQDKNNARLFCLRGDVEMFRSQNLIAKGEHQTKMATINTLWGNAGVFYRGAKRLAEAYPQGQKDVRLEAGVKEIMVEVQKQLSGGQGDIKEVIIKAREELNSFPGWDEIVIEATRIGIFDEEVLVELEQ